MYTDTDKTLAGVLSACVEAGPDHCALASSNSTAASLEKDIYSVLEKLKHRPIALEGLIVDYTAVRTRILFSLYSPTMYPDLLSLFDGLLSNNLTTIAAIMADESALAAAGNDARIGIACADKGRDVFVSADPEENGFEEKVLPSMQAQMRRAGQQVILGHYLLLFADDGARRRGNGTRGISPRRRSILSSSLGIRMTR